MTRHKWQDCMWYRRWEQDEAVLFIARVDWIIHESVERSPWQHKLTTSYQLLLSTHPHHRDGLYQRSTIEMANTREAYHHLKLDAYNLSTTVINQMHEKKQTYNDKNAQRDANAAHALTAVRFGHRPLSQTHRQDRLQYTALQLASTQCSNNNNRRWWWPVLAAAAGIVVVISVNHSHQFSVSLLSAHATVILWQHHS